MSTATVAGGPDTQAGSRLEVSHLEKSYGSRKVVKDVSLVVQKGEVVGLLGPNGAGKTTSFYMIVGLVRCDGGDIRIDGHSVADMPIHRRSRLGLSYLPQEASIFRKLNVEENVRAVLERIDAIEALGIAPAAASPAYWRTLGNRLAARLPLPDYSAERHAAWLAGRALP